MSMMEVILVMPTCGTYTGKRFFHALQGFPKPQTPYISATRNIGASLGIAPAGGRKHHRPGPEEPRTAPAFGYNSP